MTRQTHHQGTILIHLTTVITDPKKRKRKSDQKKYPIKLCARLTATFLTTAYKSKIIRFKMDENLLQRRIYFVTFLESLEIIFPRYTEICKVFLDYPKMGGEDIKYLVKRAIRNLLHENIDARSSRLIAEFSVDGIKCIEKLPSHCANTTFAGGDMTGFFSKSHIKEVNLQ